MIRRPNRVVENFGPFFETPFERKTPFVDFVRFSKTTSESVSESVRDVFRVTSREQADNLSIYLSIGFINSTLT